MSFPELHLLYRAVQLSLAFEAIARLSGVGAG
jgi:hypothetical protein